MDWPVPFVSWRVWRQAGPILLLAAILLLSPANGRQPCLAQAKEVYQFFCLLIAEAYEQIAEDFKSVTSSAKLNYCNEFQIAFVETCVLGKAFQTAIFKKYYKAMKTITC
jgi:hypothetical protein